MKFAQKLRSALSLAASAVCTLLPLLPALAQTHRVGKSETVTRAVAVYEYVGDLKKPSAARLIPVSLYLGGHFEDAGTYLSQPIPLALQNGNAYELQQAGKDLGFLDIEFARNTKQNSAEAETAYDDGWFGYGRFRAPKVPKTTTVAKNSGKSTGHAYTVEDDGKPHFGAKPEVPATDSHGRPADPDPAEERTEKVSLPEDRDPNAPNPDRPTLKRSTTDVNGGPKQKKEKVTASVSQTPPDPSNDDDRPTLKHKDVNHGEDTTEVPPDPGDYSSRKSVHGAGGTVSGAEPGLADGNRPELRRGKPGSTAATLGPDLQPVSLIKGLPLDLKQAVAVSDASNRPEHDFRYTFDSDTSRATALSGMKELALVLLADPSLASDALEAGRSGHAAMSSTARSGSGGRRGVTQAGTRNGSRRQTGSAAITPAGTTLVDEQMSAFLLNFGAPPTFVYTARTPDSTTPVRFVTVIAQQDPDGKLQSGFRSVTDTAHLDRAPRYRLVDAVDPDASNRASLLFELRNESSRQFALYRLLGPKPDQIFESGTIK